jgi:hypothetical protein
VAALPPISPRRRRVGGIVLPGDTAEAAKLWAKKIMNRFPGGYYAGWDADAFKKTLSFSRPS